MKDKLIKKEYLNTFKEVCSPEFKVIKRKALFEIL